MSLASLNSASGAVRQPKLTVTVNGTPLSGVIEAEVTNASHFVADTFRVTLAGSGATPGYGADYWADSAYDQIAVYAGTDSLTQLIIGQVDNIDYGMLGRTITLTGRDLSAPLMDTKTAEKFQNQTSSQIAQELALRHGLDSGVQKTTTRVGTYYNLDHVVLTQEQTEWDLLIYLAQQEGFDVWVGGNTLYFKPSPVSTTPPYLIRWQAPASNAMDITLSRSENLAKDIIVNVISFHQKSQKKVSVTAKRLGAHSQKLGGKAQVYTFRRPNLTADQARALADSLLADISKHERILTANLPGDGALTTRAMVRLVGSGTAWDQDYYPDTVTRTISVDDGYRMEVRAKNHSTVSTL